jgi:hypothetical protein
VRPEVVPAEPSQLQQLLRQRLLLLLGQRGSSGVQLLLGCQGPQGWRWQRRGRASSSTRVQLLGGRGRVAGKR